MKRHVALFAAALCLSGCGSVTSERPATFSASAPNGLVVLHTRVAPGPKIPEPVVAFLPYDPATKRVETNKLELPGEAFQVGRGAGMWSNAANQEWEGWIVPVEPGTYVIARATNPNSGGDTNTFARGTMMFEVKPGEAVYIGDYSFYLDDYETPNVGDIAGDFLKGFSSLGLLMPEHEFYGADVTFDKARAEALLATSTATDVPLRRADVQYVEITGGSRRDWFINPLSE